MGWDGGVPTHSPAPLSRKLEYVPKEKPLWINLTDFEETTRGMTAEQVGEYMREILDRWPELGPEDEAPHA